MKRFLIVSILMLLWLPFAGIAQEAVIIDHNCTDYTQIPDSWIQAVKNSLRIGYGHTSHGSQLVTGMQALEDTLGGVYSSDISGWGLEEGVFFNDYWAPGDLGHNGDLTWRDETINMLGLPGNDRNVVMWSWCGGCSDNTQQGINTYLNAMNQLEQSYPNITFIYMTGHLDGSGASGNLNIRNQQIRDYCIANGKVLFDFADIESYDPDALVNYMPLLCTDNCDYDSNGDGYQDSNWAQDWIDANPGTQLALIAGNCDSCAHSMRLNCVLKGAAAWWMFARIAGWEGPGGTQSTDASIKPSDITYQAADFVPGNTINLNARVRNIGNESIASGLASFYYTAPGSQNPVFIDDCNFGSIAPQGFADAPAEWNTSPSMAYGAYTITVILTNITPEDPNNSNNTAYRQMNVTQSGITVPVYRFFNTVRGGHLYTISEIEREYVQENLPHWNYEGIKFFVHDSQVNDSCSAYRFFNTRTGIHLYTISEAERDTVMQLPQYNYEGVKFCVYEYQVNQSTPVYRFFNHVRGGHLYTISEAERDAVMQLPSWTYEGIKFYVFP